MDCPLLDELAAATVAARATPGTVALTRYLSALDAATRELGRPAAERAVAATRHIPTPRS